MAASTRDEYGKRWSVPAVESAGTLVVDNGRGQDKRPRARRAGDGFVRVNSWRQ